MRLRDEDMTPAANAELAAIDAALAGDPVAADQADTAVLSALLVAERPRPSQAFAAALDARVGERFAGAASEAARGSAARAGRPLPRRARGWTEALRRPFLPAAAATLAVGLVALVVALGGGGSSNDGSITSGGTIASSAGTASTPSGAPAPPQADALQSRAPSAEASDGLADKQSAGSSADSAAAKTPAPSFRALTPGSASARKVERSASIELGTSRDHIDDVAQDVLGTTSRFGGIVDQSSVASGTDGGGAQFALRIPSTRLQPALAALSRLPDAHVLARSDDQQDVNQTYVTIRRRLADARSERAGVVRALAAATSEDETLRLRARLDALERTIASSERAQRGLDRRIDFSTVTLSIRADEGSGGRAPFTVGRALHDAGRVLSVAAGVAVIAAAALVPFALLLACTWPLARALQRRRREQALDTA
jgi:hypothetical protein